MRREWSLEDLIESWSLTDDDRRLLANKSGFTRLGFALMVKFFEIEARFPERHYEFPSAAVEFVAKQVREPPGRTDRIINSANAGRRRKETVLFKLVKAALAHPDEKVRQALWPVVGEDTLRDLAAEAEASESRRQTQIRTVLASSYTNYYRQMLPKLLDALDFRCNNTAYRPVMNAVELLHRYKDRAVRLTHYESADQVPILGVVPADWKPAVVDKDGRVERVPYELCVLRSLRDALRRREIWVVGAKRWRNPETELPTDFDVHRDVHYQAIRLPQDPTEFIDTVKSKEIATVVNQTLRQRNERWWGTGTACASDSKKSGSWQSNMMTEWHQRYGGPGVMIYWHVERKCKSVCVYSQLTTCSASEPAAMMEGLIRHSTDIEASEIRSNYTDTHGASLPAFGLTYLLGYRLLPRLKNIGAADLNRPFEGAADRKAPARPRSPGPGPPSNDCAPGSASWTPVKTAVTWSPSRSPGNWPGSCGLR